MTAFTPNHNLAAVAAAYIARQCAEMSTISIYAPEADMTVRIDGLDREMRNLAERLGYRIERIAPEGGDA